MITWTLSTSQKQARFPYRIEIYEETKEGNRTLLDLRMPQPWPVKTSRIYCTRTKPTDGPFTQVEKVKVLSYKKENGTSKVKLDRLENNKCEFQSTWKNRKRKEGSYEQICFKTNAANTTNRPRVKIPTHKPTDMVIAVDIREKHAWQFPQCKVHQAELPAGDYALISNNTVAALIKRKTFPEIIDHLANAQTLHEQLFELQRNAPIAALVIEANYGDFLSPTKQRTYPPELCTKIVAQLQARHPRLPIVYMGTRKLAKEWVFNHFDALLEELPMNPQPQAQPPAQEQPLFTPSHTCKDEPTKVEVQIHQPGKTAAPPAATQPQTGTSMLDRLPQSFTTSQAVDTFPNVPAGIIKKALANLKKAGALKCTKAKDPLWEKTGEPAPST